MTTYATAVLTERTGLNLGPQMIREALYGHRKRLLERLADLTPDQWAAATRCTEWNVHQVIRHLVDFGQYHVARLNGWPERAYYEAVTFIPASTPDVWLARSEDRTPKDTMAALADLAEAEYAAFAVRIREGDDDLMGAVPARPMLWSVRALHALWDAWLHERDLADVLGDRPSEPDTLRLVTLYSLLLAGGAAVTSGPLLETSIRLTGAPDPLYLIGGTPSDVAVSSAPPSDDPRHVTGHIDYVLDSLAGRGLPLPEALTGPDDKIFALSKLRRFMT
ncbi:maleylpyruvate isomerase family mycothiol-dependent enzyme [Actinacidiphila acididurans]|uniref:Maleylpyruvate isomerase family mycothiol-dependent enzyme n=1 Tax=Actinacidiphila acididurans TaxID=2784346 RepID=A0ABS2TTG5_9ACTN|nr:maleylpyruvate isomerase family mycothiol-dependent enzyme [Actinacidiphila acididurans]MBM9505253.1 maleylpyruvate isomerase family mycothiol-dependent enzyme [Actinacidiphila acididurans]